ncbi:MAG TPA: D-aminoacyl-tRNA deacylase [Cytophagales bacterium]|nr:D-aminoacyl-tRNA deacylase [Cytophagales bacterium]
MRLVIQRVLKADVEVNAQSCATIGKGLLILVGIHEDDQLQDASWLATKVCNMRIFHDEESKMNHSVLDIAGEILAVSQFTLYASTAKGNRPSFTSAAKPEAALHLYNLFCDKLQEQLQKKVLKGIFGADMKVSLINDGPVTIIIDSKNKE